VVVSRQRQSHKGEVSIASGRKVVRSFAKGQEASASEWKAVVRSSRSKTAKVANTTMSRAHCVARKDARYQHYPKDALYKYEDFDSESAAHVRFEYWKNFGELAAVKFTNGVKAATYGSYFTHDLFNMALVCGISLNGTTPWIFEQSCQAGEVVDASNECQIAGPFLGKKYGGIVSSNSQPPGCHVNSDGESIYNVLLTSSGSASAGDAICRVTTSTTTPLPKTIYAGVLSKLPSFTSSAYDGLEGYVYLEATAHGIGTFVKMTGTHPAVLRNAMRSKQFEAHLHAKRCAEESGGLHYIDSNSQEKKENWPEVTCDDNADCFGKDHNNWVPPSITALSIVVHDTPNGLEKAFCADLSECASNDVHACVGSLKNATSSMISKEVDGSADEVVPPAALKADPCKDDHEFCGDWATKGECGKNPAYMLIACKAACTQCTSAPQAVLAQKK